jgi:hypothetical protein
MGWDYDSDYADPIDGKIKSRQNFTHKQSYEKFF